MTLALQRRGLHGIGLNELLAAAVVPKGVLYHHFPGGKTELAVAALDAAVAGLLQRLADLGRREADPAAVLRTWLADAQRHLARSGYESGCPLAAVALESTGEDAALRSAIARGFALLRQAIAELLEHAGLPAQRARPLAALLLAAYEGALMQARVAGAAAPLVDSTAVLFDLLEHELRTHASAGRAAPSSTARPDRAVPTSTSTSRTGRAARTSAAPATTPSRPRR
jgi:TetR/AcrR family transcriptional repressor of lmrAB and yxaGH operons